LPPIVSTPLRAAVAGSTSKLTVPLPLPAAAEMNPIHATLLDAVQAHLGAELVIVTLPLPPAAGNDWLSGDIVKSQAMAPKSSADRPACF
jgi:hypothetical protein